MKVLSRSSNPVRALCRLFLREVIDPVCMKVRGQPVRPFAYRQPRGRGSQQVRFAVQLESVLEFDPSESSLRPDDPVEEDEGEIGD